MSACITVAFNDTCPLGFFCPNTDANHPPQVCLPSSLCGLERLHGFLCEAQGALEPHVCNPGRYCPIGGKQQILCPINSYCPIGSYEPIPCLYGSICPIGSSKQMYPVPAYITLAVDVILLIHLLGTIYHQWRAARKEDTNTKIQSTDGAMELDQILIPTSVTIIDRFPHPRRRRPTDQAPPDEYEMTLLRFIRRARVERGLDFEFVTAEGRFSRLARGNLVGIIGPGKTKFIKVLTGQQEPADKDAKDASGVIAIRINGHRIHHPGAFRRIISVVPREGIAIPHLTVRENVLHAARMRLPPTFSSRDVNTFVDALITSFDLYQVQHSHVGSPQHPVISDAQRRLVDIAMALAAGPTAMFLDEPTAHMNLVEAAGLIRLLKMVSQQGVTIGVTMNQPTRDIWQNIYLGAVSSHEPAGFPWEPAKPASNLEMHDLKVASGGGFRGPSWLTQVKLLSWNALLLAWREPGPLVSELAAASLVGLGIGLSIRASKGELFRGAFHPPFEALGAATDYRSAPSMGLLGSLAIGAVACGSKVRLFTQARCAREFQSGQSRSAHYLVETLATIPRLCVSSLHIAALVCVLGTPRMSFAQMYLANLMHFWGIYGQADLLAAVLPKGSRWAAVTTLILSVFGAVQPWPAVVKRYHLEWFWRCSPAAWYTEAYTGRLVSPLGHLYELNLAKAAMGYELDQYGLDIAMMFVIGVVYRILAWVGSRRSWGNNK